MTPEEIRERLKARVHVTMRDVPGGTVDLAGRAAHIADAIMGDETLAEALFGVPCELEPVDAIVVSRGSAPLGAQGRRWATLALYVDGTEQVRLDALMVGPVLGERFKLHIVDRKVGS